MVTVYGRVINACQVFSITLSDKDHPFNALRSRPLDEVLLGSSGTQCYAKGRTTLCSANSPEPRGLGRTPGA